MKDLKCKELEWIPGSGRQEEVVGKIGVNFLGTIKSSLKLFLVDLAARDKKSINLRETHMSMKNSAYIYVYIQFLT